MPSVIDIITEAATRAYYEHIDSSWDNFGDIGRSAYRTRMQHALQAAEAAAWQPITSVPKDGSPVMLYLRQNGQEYVWLDKWNIYTDRWHAGGNSRPTHWRLVPAPPASSP